MKTDKQKEEIKQIQELRQRPLTEREDAMEGLENCILDLIETEEEYKKLKENDKRFNKLQ